MAANTCKSFLWLAFSPVTIDVGRGPEFEGSVLCLVQLLLSWRNKSQAVHESLFRQNHPNLINLGSSLFVLAVITYLQGQVPQSSRLLSVGVRVGGRTVECRVYIILFKIIFESLVSLHNTVHLHALSQVLSQAYLPECLSTYCA